jgi:hypothetical protein
MTTTQTTVTRNALSDAMDALVNAGANPGGLRLWTGTAADGTQLAEFEFSATAFGASAAGVITLADVPIAGTGLADGTCQSADMVQDLTGTPVSLLEFDEADELTIDNPVIATSQSLSLTALTYTQPASE